MDKKLTTTLSIALGATLLAASAGYGIYKFIRNKRSKANKDTHKTGSGVSGVGSIGSYIGNSLVKGNSLYLQPVTNELIGGGIAKV